MRTLHTFYNYRCALANENAVNLGIIKAITMLRSMLVADRREMPVVHIEGALVTRMELILVQPDVTI
jgi:hypothetical protein